MTRKTFSDLQLHDQLVERLAEQGITEPFPIQELAIPMALKGADVIGQARTGTGKTLAFGLPLLHRIDPTKDVTQAFVIVPTRELCLQVANDLSVGEGLGIRVAAIYGGVGYEDQNRELTTGVHVVVGTPGRLLDQLNRGNLDLSGVQELVLDEADEMLDMGFLPDVERLMQACSDDRHTMLFSATMPTEVVKLARRYMSHPTFLRADTEEHEVAPTVEQHFFLVHRMDKPRLLARLLQQPGRGAVYVFTRTKRMADRLVEELGNLNTKAIAIHGDLRQSSRERNMDRFRDGKVDVLVATEVAARGLDVENATHVVNYDCPDDHKMYLHRIGRTARAGASGVAITFAEFNEVDRLNVIRKRVEAEREIEEVFSTSDEITKRFDLPERTPWDHLGRGDDHEDRKKSTSPRSSKSDGRPHNRQPSEGGRERDRSRGRAGRGASDDKAKARSTASEQATEERRPPAKRAERIRATKDDRAERVRTRTRETPAPARTPSDDERSGGRDSGREGGRDSDREGGRDSDRDSGREAGRDGGKQRTRARQRDEANSDRSASRSTSRSRARDERGRDEQRASKGSSERRKQTSQTSSNGKDRRRAGEGSKRSGAQRSSSRTELAPWEQPTSAGDEARGDGQPQLSRRVKVEHLP